MILNIDTAYWTLIWYEYRESAPQENTKLSLGLVIIANWKKDKCKFWKDFPLLKDCSSILKQTDMKKVEKFPLAEFLGFIISAKKCVILDMSNKAMEKCENCSIFSNLDIYWSLKMYRTPLQKHLKNQKMFVQGTSSLREHGNIRISAKNLFWILFLTQITKGS